MPGPEGGKSGSPAGAVHATALRLLTVRSRSTSELSAALLTRGCAAPDVAEEIERLSACGLLDDAAFAQHWVRAGVESRGRGRRVLEAELRQRGVARGLVEDALSAIDEEAEREAAAAECRKRLRGLANVDEQVRRRRLLALLARRGYSESTARAVVASVMSGAEPVWD